MQFENIYIYVMSLSYCTFRYGTVIWNDLRKLLLLPVYHVIT